MVVGKLPFTARTDGVTGEESEPPHLVFVITGFHRRKEGMERPNTAERGEGEGSQGWAGRASSEDAAPPRPNSAPSSPYLGLVCFLFFLLFLISGLFFFFLSRFPQQRQASHNDEIKAHEASTSSCQATCVLLQRRPL